MPEMRGVGEQGHVKTRKESMNAVPKRNLEMDVAKLESCVRRLWANKVSVTRIHWRWREVRPERDAPGIEAFSCA